MNIADPFGRFAADFLLARKNELGGKMGPQTLAEECQICHDRWHAYHGPKKKVRAPVEPSDVAEAIYALYPRKIGREAALRAIGKALEKDPSGRIEEKVRDYAAVVARLKPEDRAFVPHPATWFNEGRWLDDPKEWERSGMSPLRTAVVKEIEPVGWQQFMAREFPSWVRLKQEGGLPSWERLQGDEKKMILENMGYDHRPAVASP